MPFDRFPARIGRLADTVNCSIFVLMEPQITPPAWPRPPVCLPHHMLHLPPEGARVAVAGLVLVRQRPGTAKGVIFLTLEDEFGVCNVIIWQKIYQRFRRAVIAGRLLRVTGRMQRQSGVTHVVAEMVEDISPMLDDLVRLHPGARAADQP
ncbi:hypothetical protein LSUCC0031_05665 [Rhodobacterales bacterium LSUCC0031]|nr:hypothetical protein [Rhodobacterales bacterium LSUCC0031]